MLYYLLLFPVWLDHPPSARWPAVLLFDAVCICLVDLVKANLKVTVVVHFRKLLETSPAATYIFRLGQKVP